MKNLLLALSIFSFSLVLAGCQSNSTSKQPTATSNQEITDKMSTQIPDEEEGFVELSPDVTQDIQKEAYDYSGILDDVTGGNATGVALATYQDGMYKLQVNFENLPQLDENQFYEGWLVRDEPFHFISTGELIQENGMWVNYYASETDLTNHKMYVLTIEPTDDGPQGEPDPAPAEHLLEGEISKL